MAWVHEQTIPTEQLQLVGEVGANFCGQRVPRGQRDGSLGQYSRISKHIEIKTQIFLQVCLKPEINFKTLQ
jgi:hypothetical protein